MDNQDTFNEWLAEDFLLNEIERTPDLNDRLHLLLDYLSIKDTFDDEILEEVL